MKQKLKILIPDGESNLVIKVLRSLQAVSGISVYILSTEQFLGVRHSRIVRHFEHDSAYTEAVTWVNRINSLMKEHDVDVLMPVHFNAIGRLLQHKDRLFFPDRTLLPPSSQILQIAGEKHLLARHMEEVGTPYPASWPLYRADGALCDLASLKFPLLMKPILGLGGGIGIRKFANARELLDDIAKHPPREEVMLQEFVSGIDLGFNVLCRDGEILAYSIQLGTLFHKQEFKPQIGLKMIEDDAVYQSMSHLLKSLEWTGVAHIDLIYNPVNRDFKVLEINPRFWLTLHASTLAGVNFPWHYCQAAMGHKLPVPPYRKEHYLELAGLRKWLAQNPLRLLRPQFIWRHTPVRDIMRDPLILPYVKYYGMRSKTRRRASRLLPGQVSGQTAY